jgi:hypothetical protein
MKAIHWGEARDLKIFWRKEVWRGKGNLKGVLAHGLRWDELPSLGYPMYILCLLLVLVLSCVLDLSNRHFVMTLSSFGLLILPALGLAIARCGGLGSPRRFLDCSCFTWFMVSHEPIRWSAQKSTGAASASGIQNLIWESVAKPVYDCTLICCSVSHLRSRIRCCRYHWFDPVEANNASDSIHRNK